MKHERDIEKAALEGILYGCGFSDINFHRLEISVITGNPYYRGCQRNVCICVVGTEVEVNNFSTIDEIFELVKSQFKKCVKSGIERGEWCEADFS